MGELLIILVVLMLAILVAVLLVIASVFKVVGFTFRTLGSVLRVGCRVRHHPPRLLLDVPGRCRRDGCGVVNPPEARFCCRCGRSLNYQPAVGPVSLGRAACW